MIGKCCVRPVGPLTAALMGITAAFVFAFILSGASHFVPREPVIENIRTSIPLMNKFRRSDTFTECLVMGSAALGKESLLLDVFDFKMLGMSDPDPSVSHDKATCSSLRSFVKGERDQQTIGTTSYTRYFNGPVALTRMVLAVMPFLPAYILYAVACFASIGLWGWGLSKHGVPSRKAGWIAFACFYFSGIPYFAGNLSHTPAFFVPIAVVALSLLKGNWWKDESSMIGLAAFVGGLTFYFDILFMGIPFNAILLTLTALLVRPQTTVKTLCKMLAVFGFLGGLIQAVKVLIIGALTNMDAVLQDFSGALLFRVNYVDHIGTHFNAFELMYKVIDAAGKMFFHPFVLILLYILAAIGLLLAARANVKRAMAYALVASITPVWCLIFSNHSWIHATFTMRIMFWPALVGLLALMEMRPDLIRSIKFLNRKA